MPPQNPELLDHSANPAQLVIRKGGDPSPHSRSTRYSGSGPRGSDLFCFVARAFADLNRQVPSLSHYCLSRTPRQAAFANRLVRPDLEASAPSS